MYATTIRMGCREAWSAVSTRRAEGSQMPANAPDPDERSPLSPRDEAILADIAKHLRVADPAFVTRMSRTGCGRAETPIRIRAVSGLIVLLALPLIVTQTSSAIWPLLGLLLALPLLPVVLLLLVERNDRR